MFIFLVIIFFVYFAGLGEKELEVLAERVENVLAGSVSEKVSALVHLPCQNAIERRKKNVQFLERTLSSI